MLPCLPHTLTWRVSSHPLRPSVLADEGGLSWKQKAMVKTTNEFELYGVALYVALNNIFGGSCEVHPGNYPEFYLQGAMLLTGSSVWAYVIGSACGIVATLDPAGIEHRQVLDEVRAHIAECTPRPRGHAECMPSAFLCRCSMLAHAPDTLRNGCARPPSASDPLLPACCLLQVNGFVREEGMPEELAVKLREYFRQLKRVFRSRRHNALLSQMSTRLRGDTAVRMCEHHLKAVPFLVHPELEPEFMCALATRYSSEVYSRLERVPCTNLFVIERGIIAKRGALGVAGTCFGHDVILSNDNLRDTTDAIALTFLQVITLSQADIFDLRARANTHKHTATRTLRTVLRLSLEAHTKPPPL
jgi:hypothetical protein